MIKAVLLDLDDTLLGNNPDAFTARYIRVLDAFLNERAGFADSARVVIECVRAAVADDDPTRTNREAFYAHLRPRLPLPEAEFDAQVAAFYAEVYPGLQRLTRRRPVARPLVEHLIAQGVAVAVATNPLYPRVAVEQRLAWAGLPVDDIPFALVTTLDNMHFTKPDPRYLEEILGRVGAQADEAIMVGDDWANDIAPALAAGLNTFWTGPGPVTPPPDAPAPDSTGTLDDFFALVQRDHWRDSLAPRPHTSAQIAPRLTGNLAALFGIVGEAPPRVWHQHPDAAEWSPIEIVCHLVESEREVQLPRLRRIATEDNPFLSQPKAPPAPASRVCPPDVWTVAHAFAAARRETLDFLASLSPAQWQRPARHYIFGPTTLLEVTHFLAQHDRLHLTQLCQTVGRCE